MLRDGAYLVSRPTEREEALSAEGGASGPTKSREGDDEDGSIVDLDDGGYY